MNLTDITIRYQVRVGWMRFVIRAANWLSRRHLVLLAGLWLFVLQPTLIYGFHIGQYHRLGPLRWRRWSYHHSNIHVHLSVFRRTKM